MRRYLSGVSDSGVAAVAHVFTGLSPGSQTFRLEHRTDTVNKNIKTYFATLIAIPLVTASGAVLNYGMSELSGPSSTTLTSLGEVVGTQSAVTVDQSGRVWMIATFNSSTGGAVATTGTWDMQIHNGTTWVTVGTSTQRYLSGSNDEGAVMLIGLSEEVPAGSHSFRLRSSSNTGTNLDTYNATVVAIALSYDEDGGGYFPAYQSSVVSATTSSASLGPITGQEIDFTLSGSTDIFAGLSFASETATGTGNTDAFFDVAIETSVGTLVYEGQKVERDLAGDDDLGAGGIAGLTTLATPGDYTAFGEHAITGGNVLGTLQPNLVLIVLSSVSTGAQLSIDKDTTTPNVTAGGQATYVISIENTGAVTATGVTIEDVLPSGGGQSFEYVSTTTVMGGGTTRPSAGNPTAGDSTAIWGSWTIPAGGTLTITFVVDVPGAMPAGTYNNTATVLGDNFADLDDDGATGQDAGTPPGSDPVVDEDVTVHTALPGGTGDVDGDGDTDLADARIILQIVLGLVDPTPEQMDAADVDGDGDVDQTDVEIVSTCVSCGCGGP